MAEPKTTEGKRLFDWFCAEIDRSEYPDGIDLDDPAWCDRVAAIVLDREDRERLPGEAELLARLKRALWQEVGGILNAPEEEWEKAAAGILARLGLRPVLSLVGVTTFRMVDTDEHP